MGVGSTTEGQIRFQPVRFGAGDRRCLGSRKRERLSQFCAAGKIDSDEIKLVLMVKEAPIRSYCLNYWKIGSDEINRWMRSTLLPECQN